MTFPEMAYPMERRPLPRRLRTERKGALRCLVLPMLASILLPTTASSQETSEVRVLAVVDYVTGSEVYLAAGTDQGIHPGDTLAVYDGEGAGGELLGSVAIQSATARRSVAVPVGPQISVERADILYLALPKELLEERLRALEAEADTEDPAPEITVGEAPSDAAPKPDSPPVRVRGRASFDMDALQTTTRWGDSPEEEAQRTFSTPTFRLQAQAQNLPGGFRLGTSMRLSHRTSPDDLVQPVTSLRFYQLELEKRFESLPLQLHLGRFHNLFEDYSGYYDGMMVHLGEGGLGAGVALGFEPEFWSEGVSSDRPKFSGFLDYSARGEGAEYAGAISYSTLRPRSDQPDRTYVATSNRLRLGKAWFRQRLQVDQTGAAGDWKVTRLQLDATVPLSRTLSLLGGWRRWRPYFPEMVDAPFGNQHDRANAGLSFWTGEGGLSADVSVDRPGEGSEEAKTLSTSFFLRRTPLLGLGFSGMVSYWTRKESTSLILSPELWRRFGRGEVRAAYRYYGTDAGIAQIISHYADLSISFPLPRSVSIRLHGFVQWGENFSSNRVLASLSKSF